MFSVVDGQVLPVESIFGKMEMNRDGEMVMIRDKAIQVPVAEAQVAHVERVLSPKGYQATLKIRYDQNFADKFGADSVNTIRRIVAQAQNIWKWPSLTTSVTFVIDGAVDAVKGRFVAEDDIDKAGAFSVGDFNVNLMMAFRNNQPGTVGIAYMGTVCVPPKYAKLKVALCEYYVNEMKSAEVVAHEIGHNMNMDHDFDDEPGKTRYDSKGKTCSGIQQTPTFLI